jgi:hypothetical protein
MKYLMVYRPTDVRSMEEGVPPSPQEICQMGEFVQELTAAGVLLASEGCLATSRGAKVRVLKGKTAVIDGPFTETKELIAGLAVVRTKSKEEAIALAERFLKIAGDGECEIRQIFDEGDACHEPA